ncbi:putative sugar transporter [Trypanosoma grayi]|uniref:putative sugar transporter n=1 Tax=Trypanosoma grayi TaxID=71804 RepID=UPI0004F43147|nr:putative sugar transporter [Trypanosoma grayi]KEG12289.1 putative sugar transporter [Trypanosoma grayi]
MEIRCFLVHCSDTSAGLPYVEVPPPSADVRDTVAKVFGRHSPEFYWRLGNDPRCSRRMVSVSLENCVSAEEPLTSRVHPHVPQRLVLKCLGKNAIKVTRCAVVVNPGNQQARQDRFLLHRNESTVLRVGDCIGVTDRVWMQVVLACLCVNDAAKEPFVMSQDNTGRVHHSGCKVLCPQSPELPPYPFVHVDRPWQKLPSSVRASLVHTVWRFQLSADSNTAGTTTPAGPAMDTLSLTCTSEITFNGKDDMVEEAATVTVASNCSLVCAKDGTGTSSSETRSKRQQHVASSGSHAAESQALSLDAEPLQKKQCTSATSLTNLQSVPPTGLVENNTYCDTYDERLDEALCALEARVAVADRIITAEPPPPLLLGDSPTTTKGQSVEPVRSGRCGRSVGVNRPLQQVGNAQEQQQQQQFGRLGGVIATRPANDESQVVYYRH